jgi:uncharacterized protein (DUF433 family)
VSSAVALCHHNYYVTLQLPLQQNLFKFDFNNTNEMDIRVINIDPEILGRTPVFYGTRVPIKNLFDYLETGESIETFLQDFDGVKKEQVIKLLEMSQKLIETSTEILNENFA